MNAKRLRIDRWIPIFGIGALGTALGCSAGAGPSNESANVGSLQVALSGRSGGGVQYHLANATFAVTGAASATLTGDTPVLRQELPVGSYSIFLQDGWMLDVVGAGGVESVVPASLVSSNPLGFTLINQQITHVSYDFQVQGETISVGNGELSVALHVDDGLIDDFEDGDDQIARIGGRNGGWFSFTDGTNGVIEPPLGAPLLPVPDGPDGNLVMHVSGGGFTGFGAGIGATLLVGSTALAYDAAAYAGIRFKYASESWIRVNVGTAAVTAIANGGTCDPTVSVCFDTFGAFLPPAPDFTVVEIAWSALTQQGFGKVVPFDASQILTVQWNFQNPPPLGSTIASFDLRLDDVAFIPLSRSCASGLPGFFCQSNADCCSEVCLTSSFGFSSCQ